MPKKCYTKERKDKSLYTTCVEGQDKPKKKKFKIVPKKTEEKKEEPKKKKFKIVPKKPKVPTITITEEKKKKLKIVEKKKEDKPEPYKATVKTMKIGKDKPKEQPKKTKPDGFDRWDEDAQDLYDKHKGKMPKSHGGKKLYYHDFFDTDGSMTLSSRKTKNYDIPTYVREADGYAVGRSRWRDYSWDG